MSPKFTVSGFQAIEEAEAKFGNLIWVTSFLLLRSIIETTPASDAAAIMWATRGFHAISVVLPNNSVAIKFGWKKLAQSPLTEPECSLGTSMIPSLKILG